MKLNNKIKIFGLYFLSLFCILIFLIINNSINLKSLIIKADNFRPENGFFLFLTTGFIKYGILIIGISIFTILTYKMIKKIW
ncbi:hypothetical protein JM83_3193 [Gillisia sp. Hel_I_86]|nr:hypothetical protein JM83_3193 [Gillisia sp. Hel_I_86]